MFSHCCRCFALRQPARFFSMNSTAHSRKVRPFATASSLRLPLGFLGVERVYPIVPLLAVRCRLPARFCERDIGVGSKPHVAALAVELEPEHP